MKVPTSPPLKCVNFNNTKILADASSGGKVDFTWPEESELKAKLEAYGEPLFVKKINFWWSEDSGPKGLIVSF